MCPPMGCAIVLTNEATRGGLQREKEVTHEMRRIVSLVTMGVVMAALMAALAAPAFAQGLPKEPPPPNCEKGQHIAHTKAFERFDLDREEKLFEKEFACFIGEPPGEGHQ